MAHAELEAIASQVAEARGLYGKIQPIGDRWLFSCQRGKYGASATIEGQPDRAILEEALSGMIEALNGDD